MTYPLSFMLAKLPPVSTCMRGGRGTCYIAVERVDCSHLNALSIQRCLSTANRKSQRASQSKKGISTDSVETKSKSLNREGMTTPTAAQEKSSSSTVEISNKNFYKFQWNGTTSRMVNVKDFSFTSLFQQIRLLKSLNFTDFETQYLASNFGKFYSTSLYDCRQQIQKLLTIFQSVGLTFEEAKDIIVTYPYIVDVRLDSVQKAIKYMQSHNVSIYDYCRLFPTIFATRANKSSPSQELANYLNSAEVNASQEFVANAASVLIEFAYPDLASFRAKLRYFLFRFISLTAQERENWREIEPYMNALLSNSELYFSPNFFQNVYLRCEAARLFGYKTDNLLEFLGSPDGIFIKSFLKISLAEFQRVKTNLRIQYNEDWRHLELESSTFVKHTLSLNNGNGPYFLPSPSAASKKSCSASVAAPLYAKSSELFLDTYAAFGKVNWRYFIAKNESTSNRTIEKESETLSVSTDNLSSETIKPLTADEFVVSAHNTVESIFNCYGKKPLTSHSPYFQTDNLKELLAFHDLFQTQRITLQEFSEKLNFYLLFASHVYSIEEILESAFFKVEFDKLSRCIHLLVEKEAVSLVEGKEFQWPSLSTLLQTHIADVKMEGDGTCNAKYGEGPTNLLKEAKWVSHEAVRSYATNFTNKLFPFVIKIWNLEPHNLNNLSAEELQDACLKVVAFQQLWRNSFTIPFNTLLCMIYAYTPALLSKSWRASVYPRLCILRNYYEIDFDAELGIYLCKDSKYSGEIDSNARCPFKLPLEPFLACSDSNFGRFMGLSMADYVRLRYKFMGNDVSPDLAIAV